jgi:flagellar biosynthetic protein FlhB
MADSDQDKTEQPTSRKQEESREKGDVATSMEVATFFVILGGLIMLYFSGLWMADGIMKFMREPVFPFNVELNANSAVALYRVVLRQYYIIMLPAFAIPIFGVLAYVLQNGINLTLKPLAPNFSKINPISGVKQLFSVGSLMNLAKSVLKVGVLSYVMYINVKKEWHLMPSLVEMEVVSIFAFVTTVAFKVMIKSVWVLAVIAIVDYAYQKWHFNKGQMMTKEEVKEENKESEGDPMVKSRIRSVQREQARKRMMQAVETADVVVTNPTHLAVAIKYDRLKAGAPVVVAKGAGLIADRIKELAKEHMVPIVEDKPLARSLFKHVEIGMEIPMSLYKAVAEILAYVYRLSAAMSAAPGGG